MAQLGAIAVWKNYKENPEKGLQQYIDALNWVTPKPLKKYTKPPGSNLILAQAM
jgi:oligoendopeptidase F